MMSTIIAEETIEPEFAVWISNRVYYYIDRVIKHNKANFTFDELKAMRPETTTNGLRQMVFKWERKGMVVKVSKDNYEKCQSR